MGESKNVLSHLGRLDGLLLRCLSTGDEYWEVLLGLACVSYESQYVASDVPFVWQVCLRVAPR